MNIFDPDAGEAAMIAECSRRALDMVADLEQQGLAEGERLATAVAFLGLTIAKVSDGVRENVIENGWKAVMDIVRRARGVAMNNPLSDGETDPCPARLARIADSHLDQLAKLTLNDQVTVATTILGSVMMQVDPGQHVEMLDHLMGSILLHLQTGGMADGK